MRKNIIALMLVLPILFVLVVYSAVNVASLDVQISVNGIEIMERYPGDTISIDLADYNDSYEITPSVQPANASNKQFEYRYERISGAASDEEVAAGGVVEVVHSDKDGIDRIEAKSVGTVRIVAVSKDGGYEDSITAIVGASKPYAFGFSMFEGGNMQQDVLTQKGEGYSANLRAGQYGFAVKLKPNAHLSPEFELEEGFLQANAAGGVLTLPFTGKTAFNVIIPNGAKGPMIKHVELNITNDKLSGNTDEFAVNGSTEPLSVISFDRGSNRAEFFVEAKSKPSVTCFEEDVSIQISPVEGVMYGWRVNAAFPEEGNTFDFAVSVGDVVKNVTLNGSEFDFSIRTDIPNFNAAAGTNILMGIPISFYAVPISVATGITYKWDFINVTDMNTLSAEPNADGSVCTVTANARDKFIIVVEALRDNGEIVNMDAHELDVEVINNVEGIQGINTNLGLAKSRAVAGWKYQDGQKIKNIFPVNISAYSHAGLLPDGIQDLEFSVDSRAAELVKGEDGELLVEDGCVYLDIKGKGEITLNASWKGNAEWRTDEPPTELNIKLTVDSEAVEVTTASQLMEQTADGVPVVLGADIMLGTDDSGQKLGIETRRGMLKTLKSTFNTDYYSNCGTPELATVNYVLEFKNNLYGNGHSICGEYFSNEKDSTGKPYLFTGPLNLVSLGDFASVAAQDNIVFLCRTDGVTLYNATLLGCSDGSRINQETQLDDLTLLTNTGTVLEINSDVNLLNCRVRNGRNVVRVYGGNSDGNSYFINSLSDNRLSSQDRAVVNISGCILSHSREFVLKAGANRALRSTVRNGREPYFVNRNGQNYLSPGDSYVDDAYFYQTYVLTDVTLNDSVLEKSGLFCVGIETNFAGEMLYEGSSYATGEEWKDLLGPWAGVGGTSFATVLRLEGNVRMYDWKDIGNINSDTLIASSMSEFPLKLDLSSMIEYMCNADGEFNSLIERADDGRFVHGGIALYGGGRNYSQVSLGGLDPARRQGLQELRINISALADADNDMSAMVGAYLPKAAGTQDFRFFMYQSTGANNRQWQASADYLVAPAQIA